MPPEIGVETLEIAVAASPAAATDASEPAKRVAAAPLTIETSMRELAVPSSPTRMEIVPPRESHVRSRYRQNRDCA